MRKFQEFFVFLTGVRSLVRRAGNNTVKRSIGDSTKNKRTITVGQLVRFLTKNGEVRGAKEIEAVVTLLEKDILSRRKRRTDAIDLTELTNTYRDVVMSKGQLRREIGSRLSNVSK